MQNCKVHVLIVIKALLAVSFSMPAHAQTAERYGGGRIFCADPDLGLNLLEPAQPHPPRQQLRERSRPPRRLHLMADRLGKLSLDGVLSGFGLVQANYTNGDQTSEAGS